MEQKIIDIQLVKAHILFLCAALLVTVNGCVFIELEKEVAEIEKTFSISGRVIEQDSETVPLVVVLYRSDDGAMVVDQYMIADEMGYFSFLAPEGFYGLAAFADLNWDQSYNDGEWYGYHGFPDPMIVNLTEKLGEEAEEKLKIKLDRDKDFVDELPRDADEGMLSLSWIKLAKETTLDNPLFAQENGSLGFWKPLAFLRDVGLGLYFLEPYDAEKVPVLFVHGANGTPAGWEQVIEKLDRRRFQPWFYYYPSGFRLDAVANGLNELIQELQEEFRFSRMHVVAQSMGGLVSRAFIVKNAAEYDQIDIATFVSVSTPWGGVNTATMGIENAPAVIPSWYDVAPGSDFLQHLYDQPLPAETMFYLIYSIRGPCSMLMGNNDGTVEIASQVDYRAFRERAKSFPFNEDHGSIIYNEQVIDLILALLTGDEKAIDQILAVLAGEAGN